MKTYIPLPAWSELWKRPSVWMHDSRSPPYDDGSDSTTRRANRYRIPTQRLASALVLAIHALRVRRWTIAALVLFCFACLCAWRNQSYNGAVKLANQSPIESIPYDGNVFPTALYPERLKEEKPFYFWENYPSLNGFYNGIRTLVPLAQWTEENRYNKSAPSRLITKQEARELAHRPSLVPTVLDPYDHFTSDVYLRDHQPVQQCYLDDADTVPVPQVLAYHGLPQNMTANLLGSHALLGMEQGMCYDRYSRFAAYGCGLPELDGGVGLGVVAENEGAEEVFTKAGYRINADIDWAKAQKRCYDKNRDRFQQAGTKIKVSRHALLLRIWDGFDFGRHYYYTVRALVNELALKSGGEYDIHFLLHVKDGSLPWQTDSKVRETIVNRTLPLEFRSMAVLWSEELMMTYYPGPFPDAFENPALVDRPQKAGIHQVLRSAHFPVQWFAQQRNDYDYYWNWELDTRLTGHYYDFFTKAGNWAKEQPRKELWERNSRFYLEKIHGSWANFVAQVHKETTDAGQSPVWGPLNYFPNKGMIKTPSETTPPHSSDKDDYQWGVGEDADLLVFDPIFEPNTTNWQFQKDVTGYDLNLPLPPRRCSIVGNTRMSRRMIDLMHAETAQQKHTMFLEMWAPTVALHHGLKAVYIPHPVWYDHDWDLQVIDQTLNRPRTPEQSPFGWGEHNMRGSSYYYDSRFAAQLWNRWLGIRVRDRGGRQWEEKGTGRMCLQTMLLHPIKHEGGRTD